MHQKKCIKGLKKPKKGDRRWGDIIYFIKDFEICWEERDYFNFTVLEIPENEAENEDYIKN